MFSIGILTVQSCDADKNDIRKQLAHQTWSQWNTKGPIRYQPNCSASQKIRPESHPKQRDRRDANARQVMVLHSTNSLTLYVGCLGTCDPSRASACTHGIPLLHQHCLSGANQSIFKSSRSTVPKIVSKMSGNPSTIGKIAYVRLVPQCPQNVLVRFGELPNHFTVEPSAPGAPAFRTSIAGRQGPSLESTFGEAGLGGGAGRRETVIISAGTQIQVGRMEPVAVRQSLQWSVVTKGRWTGFSGMENGWREREESRGISMR